MKRRGSWDLEEIFQWLIRFISAETVEPAYNNAITAITYLNGKIITQESVGEGDQPDPSEGQDWNWEDYE